MSEELTIVVRRQWNDWREAVYRINDISGLHWSEVSGGVQAVAPRPFLHGYVMCDGMTSGELAHSGTHGNCPHRIKVCILKGRNTQEVYQRLAAQAGGTALVLEKLKQQRAEQAEIRRRKIARLVELLKDPVMAGKSDLALARLTGLRCKKIAELRANGVGRHHTK